MKKYLLFKSLSQCLLTKASNTQSFNGAAKSNRSSGWKQFSLLLFFVLLLSFRGESQVTASVGDYASVAAGGNWNSASTWLVYTGATNGWLQPGTTNATSYSAYPNGTTTNVFIQTGSVVKINVSSINVNNLYIATSLASNALLSGQINLYDGTNYNTLTINGTINDIYQSAGALVSSNTTATVASQYSSFISTSTTIYPITSGHTGSYDGTNLGTVVFYSSANNVPVTINANYNAVGIIQANVQISYANGGNSNTCNLGASFRATNIEVVSGTFAAGGNRVGAGSNSTTAPSTDGNFVVDAGATFSSSQTALQVLCQNTSSCALLFNLKAGATLQLTGTTPYMDAQTVKLNGTVIYSKSGAQNFLQPSPSANITSGTEDATGFYIYNNLTLSGSSAKTTIASITTTVNGTLSFQSTASLAIGGSGATLGSLTYGSNATLEYAGTTANATPTTTEWPSAAGTNASNSFTYNLPPNVNIGNASNGNGVKLPASFSRTISGKLSLINGAFDNSTNAATSTITIANGGTVYDSVGTASTALTYGTGTGVSLKFVGNANIPSSNNLLIPANASTGIINSISASFSSTASLTLPSTLNNTTNTLTGSLATNGNSTIVLAADLAIQGNLSNAGAITQSTYTITLNSSTAAQTLSSASTLTNLTINNTYATTPTVTLSGNVNVSGTLKLTAGVVITSPTNLLTITNTTAGSIQGRSGGTSATSFSNTNYISGPLALTLAASAGGNTTYVYPIGAGGVGGTYYSFELVNPITTSSTSAVVKAQAITGSTGGSGNLLSFNSDVYWSTSATNAGSLTSTTIRLTDASYGSATVIASSSTLAGTSYASIGGNSVNSPSNSITSSSVAGSSFPQYLVMAAIVSVLDPTFSVTNPTPSASQLTLSVSDDANHDNIVVVYNTTGIFSIPTAGTSPVSNNFGASTTLYYYGSVGSINTTLNSLTSNTLYYFKAYSYDANNNYSAGIAASATTLPIVTNGSVANLTATGFKFTGTVTTGNSATLTATGVSYGTSPSPTNANNSSSPTYSISKTFSSITPAPESQIYANVYATNAAGTARSSDVSFYLPSVPPTAQGSNFYLIQKTTSSFSLELGNAATFPTSATTGITNNTKGGYVAIYVAGTTAPALISSPNGVAPANIFTTGTQISGINETSLNSASPTLPTVTGVTVSSLSAGTYTVILVPYTYDGTAAHLTYNYLTSGALTATVTLSSAVATWDMNATNQGTPITVGNVTAQSPTFNNYLYQNYSSADFLQTSYNATPGSWNADQPSGTTTENSGFTGIVNTGASIADTRYIDFKLSPASGSQFTLSKIVVPIKSNNSSSSSMVFSLGYSTDGTNFTPFSNTTLSSITATGSTISGNDVKISTPNAVITTSFTPSSAVTVNTGSTLTLRAILWRGTTSSSNNTTVDFQPMLIAGSTTVIAPTAAATSVNASGIADQSFALSWSKASDASNSLVVVYPFGATPVTPSNISYTATGTYSTGSSLGTGKVLYNGMGSSTNVAGLSASTAYTVYVYQFNTDGTTYQYLATAASTDVTTTASPKPVPTNYPTSFTTSAINSNSLSFTWTDATGAQLPDNYLVILSTTTITAPTNGVAVSDATFSGGIAYKNVAYGTQAVSFTGLTPGTQYNVAIYPYTNAGVAIVYKTSSGVPTQSPYTYSAAPTAQPFTFDVVPASATSLKLTWSGTTGATGYAIYRSTSSNPSVSGFTNATAPNSQTLGSGVTLVTTTTGNSYTDNGLSGKYYYTIVPYGYSGNNLTYNYLLTNALSSSATVLSDIATYSFASDGTPTIVGNITANLPNITGYTSPSYNNGLVISPDGAGTWPVEGTTATTNTTFTGSALLASRSTTLFTRSITFSVKPATGYDFKIQQITVPVTVTSAIPNINYSVAYSTDNTTWTQFSSTALSNISTAASVISNTYDVQVQVPNNTVTTTFIPSGGITLPNGTTLYVRLVLWNKSGNTRTSTTATIGNVVIAGTATAIPTPVITSPLTDNTNVGTPDSYTITATNSPISYTATGLPSFMSFDGTTGVITVGASSTVGTYSISIGANNGSSTGTNTLVYTINPNTSPVVNSPLTASATVGQPFSYQITATNSPSSYAASGLPAGLTINSLGRISGTPSTSGTYNVTITVTNSTASASKTLVITTAAATYYYYSGTGAMNIESNWLASNGSGAASTVAGTSGLFTTSGISFEINTNASTSGGTWSPTGTVIVGNTSKPGITLTITSGNRITGTINVTAASSGTNTLLLQDVNIPTFGTLDATSTVEYGASVAQTITTVNYANLTISNTSATGATTIAGSSLTVTGTLTVATGGTLSLGAATTTSIVVFNSVVVNGTLNFPGGFTNYISGNASLYVNSGATIYLGSSNGISLASSNSGNFRTSGNRTFNANVSYVFQNTTSTSPSSGNGFPSPAANVTVNVTAASAVLTLSQALDITGKLTVTAGTLATGNFLTLKSTSIANTAVVTNVCASCAITGKATVERYIPKGFRAYRDMAPEVYNAGSIYNNWQSGGSYSAGSGIFITGPTAYPGLSANAIESSTGFDETGTVSLNTQDYTYDPSYTNPTPIYGHFKALTSTSTNLDAFAGYRLLIRGDRTPNLYTSNVTNTQSGLAMYNATTLKATGNLVYGNVIYSTTGVIGAANGASATSTSALSTASNGFSMIANPYVSPVSWTAVYNASITTPTAASTSNINGSYWYLDPTSGATGKYIAYNALTGSPTTVNGKSGNYTNTGTVPSGTDFIQPGQAFFVQNASTGTPTVLFTESCKQASSANLKGIFGTASLSKIYVSLMKQTSGATTYDRVDGAAVAFRSDFGNKAYGPQDALKLAGATDNLSISDKGKNLSIDGRLPATTSDAVSLAISKPSGKSYQLQVDATAYASNGFAPVLYDAYKNTTTKLGAGVSTVDFTIDTAVSSSYSNRFTILFTPSALPVNSIVASASLNNKVATITWNTVGEKSVARYEVEKSTDAKTFATIGQSTAKNTATASYAITDNSVTATSYYRIKAVSTTGNVSYSNIAKLSIINYQLSISLYPNPLKGKTLNVALDNVVAGKYTVSIYNALGQKVNEQTITHTGGSATHALTIGNTLAAGVYNVAISEAGSKQLVHQSTLSIQP